MVVKFDTGKVLINQFIGHHKMLEIYAHMYAATFLFIASLISVYILYKLLINESSPFTWPGITSGIIAVGLIGLGEAAEHLFPTDPFGQGFFHYMHMIAAPIALYFLYIGAKEFIEECKNGGAKMGGDGGIEPLSPDTIMAIFGGMVVLVVALAMLSGSPWDPYIELPFIYITLIPTLILAYMLIQQSRQTTESLVMVFIPIIAISVSFLVFDIMFGRLMDIWGWAEFYVITHAAQVALHVATGTILLLFSISTYRAQKLGMLYVRGERPEYEPPAQEKIPMKDYF